VAGGWDSSDGWDGLVQMLPLCLTPAWSQEWGWDIQEARMAEALHVLGEETASHTSLSFLQLRRWLLGFVTIQVYYV